MQTLESRDPERKEKTDCHIAMAFLYKKAFANAETYQNGRTLARRLSSDS